MLKDFFFVGPVYMDTRKVVFSFTTSPTRIKECSQMIRSVLNQTVKPDLVLLNVPEVFARTGEPYEIPEEISELVTVNSCKHDYGPGTKIVPTVSYLRENGWEEDTIVIYGDDDIWYPPCMISTYKSLAADSVWCVSGFDFMDGRICGSRDHGNKTSIAEGYGSVSTSLSFFDSDFEEYMRELSKTDDLKFSDDVTISNYLWGNSRPIRVCNIEYTLGFRLLWHGQSILAYGNGPDALHKGACGTLPTNQERYKRVVDALTSSRERYFPLFTSRPSCNKIEKPGQPSSHTHMMNFTTGQPRSGSAASLLFSW